MKKILNLILLLLLTSCSTSSGVLDILMPDRLGIGHSFVNGSMSSRMTGDFMGAESGSYDEDINAVWFEWDIPTVNSSPRSSFADMRERVTQDYSNFREPKQEEDSIVSITRHSVMDEETGEISETWDFGLSSAIYSALATFLTIFGYKLMRSKATGDSSSSESGAEE